LDRSAEGAEFNARCWQEGEYKAGKNNETPRKRYSTVEPVGRCRSIGPEHRVQQGVELRRNGASLSHYGVVKDFTVAMVPSELPWESIESTV
jgi:hypothetical protein